MFFANQTLDVKIKSNIVSKFYTIIDDILCYM